MEKKIPERVNIVDDGKGRKELNIPKTDYVAPPPIKQSDNNTNKKK